MVATAMSQALMTSPVGTESKQVLFGRAVTQGSVASEYHVQGEVGQSFQMNQKGRKPGCNQCCHPRNLKQKKNNTLRGKEREINIVTGQWKKKE